MRWIKPLLPVHFDKNEIYTIVIFVLVIIIKKWLPKRMETSLFLFFYIFNLALTVTGDYFLAGNPIDLYDTLDRNCGELFDFMLHLFVYPISILILLTLYSYLYRFSKWISLLFILLASFLLFCLEWISTKYFNLFTYYNWKIGYSYIVYCLTISINVFLFHKLQKYYQQVLKFKKGSDLV